MLSGDSPECGPLEEDVDCKCLVVGSGITGALAAYHLAEEGVGVVLIDRRAIARGSTPASTALLQYDIDTPLVELRHQLGKEPADRAYRRSRRALTDMSNLIQRLGLDCDLAERPSLYLAHSAMAADGLRKETEARAQIGMEVEFLTAVELRETFGINRPGAILSQVALQIDPWKFTKQMLCAAIQRGAKIYGETELRIPSPPGPVREFQTTSGHRIRTNHAVLATGYETPDQFTAIANLCELSSTFVVATHSLPEDRLWPRRALIWETADPYLYARTAADNRVIIGGEDEPFQDARLRDSLIPAKTEVLLRKFRATYPIGDVEVETAWAGTFAQTRDGLPYIGQMKAYPRYHFALGYGGNGITFSLIAAQIIRDGILGRTDPDAPVFSFDRKIID
jgi:glycine/D-amino acid oxidase-like deaminating enzyme